MKNYRTPRTLADCEFTVGHPSIPRRRPTVWCADTIVGLICAVGLVGVLTWVML